MATTGTKKAVAMLCMLLVTLSGRPASAAQYIGVLKKSWQPLCEATTELGTLPSDVAHSLQEATKQIKAMILEATRAAIYVRAKGPSKQAEQAAVMSGYMLTSALQGLEQLQHVDIPAGIKLSSTGPYLKGRIDEFLDVARKVHQGGEGCILSSSGSVLSGTDGKTLDSTPCSTSLPKLDPAEHALQHITPTGLKTAQDPQNDANQHQHTATANCRLFSATSTHGLGHSGNVGNQLTWAAGYYTVQPTSDGVLTVADLRQGEKSARRQETAWNEVFAAVKDRPNKGNRAYANKSQEIATDPVGASMLFRILINDVEATPDKLKPELTALFGTDVSQSVSKVFADINDLKLATKVAGIEAGTQLGTISDAQQLGALLAHYSIIELTQHRQLRKKLSENEKQTAKTHEQICNEIKDATECGKNENCKYDDNIKGGPKCVLNETGKKGCKTRKRESNRRER
uniref:Variant surface glycoprotein 1125.4713 n=1 Tax=Trypanosoma brucei TaxID=5691 RepID=A0A1J0RAU0_9TRYP|nr:variant surface glycoprotein 1125.4713 [Trypanosoma brucei]